MNESNRNKEPPSGCQQDNNIESSPVSDEQELDEILRPEDRARFESALQNYHSEPKEGKSRLKLGSTSRAICLFRRAAGSLSRSLTLSQISDNNNGVQANPLADGGIGLADGLSRGAQRITNGKESISGRKSSSFRRFIMMRHHAASSSDKSSSGQYQANTENCDTEDCTDKLEKLQHTVLIVPRINALRLPLRCLIRSLEGELMREVFVHRYELGQYLIENLKASLGMNDCKYFGLRFARGRDDQENAKNPWLDLNESVCKQIKSLGMSHNNNNNNNNSQTKDQQQTGRTIEFYLRIKFYPPNLNRIQDEFLRNYLWLQLRRDLRLGKLTSSIDNLAQLMACVMQFELGDYRVDFIIESSMNILPNQDLVEDNAIELWKTKLIGFKRHQAQAKFLRIATILETYGFDYYPVRDHQRQRAYLLGFNYAGIKTIRNGKIIHHFRWHSIIKISYERRMIIFHTYPTENSKRKQILGFKCMSNEDCQCLYMRILEQKYFFTVDLTYFDKTIRRPSCLLSNSSSPRNSIPETDWDINNNNNNVGIDCVNTSPYDASMQQAAKVFHTIPPKRYQSLELNGQNPRPSTKADFHGLQDQAAASTTSLSPDIALDTPQSSNCLCLQHDRPTAVTCSEPIYHQQRASTSLEQNTDQAVIGQLTSQLTDHLYNLPIGWHLRSSCSNLFNFNGLASILKLLFVVLMTNLIFRLTDSLSHILVTLLTFSDSSAHPNVPMVLEEVP